MKWAVRALIVFLSLFFVVSLPGVHFLAREAISWKFGGLITLGIAAIFGALMVRLYRMSSDQPAVAKRSSRRMAVVALSIVSLLLVGVCAFSMWVMVEVGIGMAKGDRLPPRPPPAKHQ